MNRICELAETHMKEKKLSRQELASRLSISRSMLSQYLSGTYSNPAAVEEKLLAYFEEQGVTISESNAPIVHGNRFYQSSDARRILAVCSACQEYSVLGVIAGKSGFGKTYTLKEYAKLPDVNVAYIECDDTMGRVDLVEALEAALGMARGYGSLCRRTNEIIAHLAKRPGYLIIVDEADKLISKSTQKKMEILRKLVDRVNVGMVLAGEPQLIAV